MKRTKIWRSWWLGAIESTCETGLVALAVGGVLIAAPAMAQDKPAKGVITLAEVTIVGRIQKPIASVDVNRIQPEAHAARAAAAVPRQDRASCLPRSVLTTGGDPSGCGSSR